MPTLSSGHYRRRFRRALTRQGSNERLPRRFLTVVDERMNPTREVGEILDLVAKNDAVLDAGYLHLSEIRPLFAEARRRGVRRFIVNDPDRYAEAQPEEIGALAGFGAMIGFSLDAHPAPVERLAAFRDVPRESLIVHLGAHDEADGDARLVRAAAFIEKVGDNGLRGEDIRAMMGENAARLLAV